MVLRHYSHNYCSSTIHPLLTELLLTQSIPTPYSDIFHYSHIWHPFITHPLLQATTHSVITYSLVIRILLTKTLLSHYSLIHFSLITQSSLTQKYIPTHIYDTKSLLTHCSYKQSLPTQHYSLTTLLHYSLLVYVTHSLLTHTSLIHYTHYSLIIHYTLRRYSHIAHSYITHSLLTQILLTHFNHVFTFWPLLRWYWRAAKLPNMQETAKYPENEILIGPSLV